MRTYLAIIATVILAACSSSPIATANPASTSAPSTAPVATLAPTTVATVTPTAAAASSACIISTPQQIGTDLTPVVIRYEGYTEAQCADALVVKADASDFAKANPPSRLDATPSEAPKCSKTLVGITLTIWGGAAADFACASIK